MGNNYKKKNHKPVQERPVNEVLSFARVYGSIDVLDYLDEALKSNMDRLTAEYGRPLTDRERILTVAGVIDSIRDELVNKVLNNTQLQNWMSNCDFTGQTVTFKQREEDNDGDNEIGDIDTSGIGDGVQLQAGEGDNELIYEADTVGTDEGLRPQGSATELRSTGNETYSVPGVEETEPNRRQNQPLQ